ncbi:hypothetical protein [Anaeromusa sp.]|uniref:hypothetical protein n=1 Tax=Anaeromusa sp. TaxID=1872520 RepID=UPI00261C07A7|nr:hypothetical protein [Anaeromusa sp.]MDD3159028.1 hypothetical protein [Anaeromusa sp.]
MIRVEMFEIHLERSCNPLTKHKEWAPIEAFIEKVGYANVKNIIVAPSTAYESYYSIFYEDGQPYTPYVEEEPKKKGIFG